MEYNKSLPVYKGKTEPLDKVACEHLVKLVMGTADAKTEKLEKAHKDDYPFTSRVVESRVEAMKLPIKFTDAALLAVDIFAKGNPGNAVLFLIDSLNHYEGKTVTLHDESLQEEGFICLLGSLQS